MPQVDWDKRHIFIQAYAECGNATQSAIAAGVPVSSAHSTGYRWLRNPQITDLIQQELNDKLRGIGPTAISVLKALLVADTTPPQVRLQAARDVLDRLGWVPPKRAEMAASDSQRPVVEMTNEELDELITGMRGVRLTTESLEAIANGHIPLFLQD